LGLKPSMPAGVSGSRLGDDHLVCYLTVLCGNTWRSVPGFCCFHRGTGFMFVQNRVQLLSHGSIELRRTSLDIVEHALEAADPYPAVKKLVRLDGEHLTVGELSCDLSEHGEVYVLGAGKATLRIAEALEDVLGDRIRQGLIAIKRGQPHALQRIRVIEASHPYPDETSYQAARSAMALARRAQAGDVVFTAITGGSSALLCHPVDGVTLEEKSQLHKLLLGCGASIFEINAVRKHLSKVKGGLLAQMALPAQLINLTVSDVIGDRLDYIVGPVVADTSCVSDAVDVLQKHSLWDRVAPSVRAHLGRGTEVETPKVLDKQSVHTFVVVPSSAAALAASIRADELGFRPLVLTTCLTGESREVGACLGAIAREIAERHRPTAPPCVLIASGENTVAVRSTSGSGGPSQELALSIAGHIEGLSQVVAACLDTDGTDGPTDFAGAIVDGLTHARAREQGIDVYRAVLSHDVTSVLRDVGDIVNTGATGTNVADLVAIVVGR